MNDRTRDKARSLGMRYARGDKYVFDDDWVLAQDAWHEALTEFDTMPSGKQYKEMRDVFLEAYMDERKKTVRKKMHITLRDATRSFISSGADAFAHRRAKGYENPAAAVTKCKKYLLPGADKAQVYQCALRRRGLERGATSRNDQLWADNAKRLSGFHGAKRKRKR